MAWTKQQEQAITARGSGCIVSAAAGSGKTSVLVERLLRILMDTSPEHRVPADRLIVVTFTNDAAAEMRARLYQAIAAQLKNDPENAWLNQQQILLQSAHICTISSFCFDLIRDNMIEDGITAGFRILNETETSVILEKALGQLLDDWEETHPEEMKSLWDHFCEKSFSPLENLLLDLHTYLAAVPFRDAWCQAVLASYQPAEIFSVYETFFMTQFRQDLQRAIQLAQEAVDLSMTLYDDIQENTVYPWVETDMRCFRQLWTWLTEGSPLSKAAAEPILEKRLLRQRKPFPKKKKSITDADAYAYVKQLRSEYSKLEDSILHFIMDVMPYGKEDLEKHRIIVPILFQMEQELSERIWAEKVQKNALSFEDGERLALELLAVRQADGRIYPSELARELQSYYQLIMIDEYQDSNNKQDDIFKLLSRNCIDPQTKQLRYGDNVFLVGDAKQSIYRFRLANPQNFVNAISAAKQDNQICRHIVLNRNFRSVPAVLNFVNFVCGHLMSPTCGNVDYTEEEALYPGAELGECLDDSAQGVEIAICRQASEESDAEVAYIVAKIQQMVAQKVPVMEKNGSNRSCHYGDFCILLRNNAHCIQVAHMLEAAGIPVQSPEEKGYLQSREISILLDLLRVLDNPLLDTSLAAVMLSPLFWFTPDELLQVRMLAKNASLYSAVKKAAGLETDLPTEKKPSSVPPLLRKKCRGMVDMLQKLRQASAMMPLDLLIRHIYDRTDFLSVMQLTKDGNRKRANLYLLMQYAKQYIENTEASRYGVSGFLRYIDWLLESGNDFQQSGASAGDSEAVAVKTMHRSKGLEYPFVFLAKLETKFSTQDSKKTALFSDTGMMGLCIKDPDTYVRAVTLPYEVLQQENQMQSKSEELRLLYVAMTRARQKLMIPLLADKLVTKQRKYLEEYATMIPENGTLSPRLVQSASSMAQWLWMCLLLRHDAALSEKVDMPKKHWDKPAWVDGLAIHYTFAVPEMEKSLEETIPQKIEADAACTKQLRELIGFCYVSQESELESLLSVSAVQELHNAQAPIWKRPKFVQQHKLTGAERGTAVHTFFQYANFHLAEQSVSAEVQRLHQKGYLTSEQIHAIDSAQVENFFRDAIYQRMRRSNQVLREYKFQVQCRDLCRADESAAAILHRYQDADSMLQGIIDLSFREEEGFVLVDYKTDVVSDAQKLLETYREQILLYRAALRCITGVPVRACYLYSTHLGKSILLPMEK